MTEIWRSATNRHGGVLHLFLAFFPPGVGGRPRPLGTTSAGASPPAAAAVLAASAAANTSSPTTPGATPPEQNTDDKNPRQATFFVRDNGRKQAVVMMDNCTDKYRRCRRSKMVLTKRIDYSHQTTASKNPPPEDYVLVPKNTTSKVCL